MLIFFLSFVAITSLFLGVIWRQTTWANALCKIVMFVQFGMAIFLILSQLGYVVKI